MKIVLQSVFKYIFIFCPFLYRFSHIYLTYQKFEANILFVHRQNALILLIAVPFICCHCCIFELQGFFKSFFELQLNNIPTNYFFHLRLSTLHHLPSVQSMLFTVSFCQDFLVFIPSFVFRCSYFIFILKILIDSYIFSAH